ncbi:primosomal protein N' (replication factor Y) - superfamily II helicase [Shimia sp. R9_2]|uniref:TFIIB-type zinc finger domain-containing protein n=1 Tax=Shimia sp. R9_2 TaxID=2821112 RepID=UPI001ADC6885|nr:TFIIB-type zinc finger domain-containing protein [Shimia sp. R9_2]MBO9398320.1 primosomal protein N' (replication factor Y) - superfamily II helicase [Shimia sp. R9_2]
MTATPPPAPQETTRFPCPQCGADYRFAPAQGKLICDHCGHEEATEQGDRAAAITELDFRAALAEQLPAAEVMETRATTCPNCAAHVVFDGDTHATECAFCATPVVVDTGTHRQIKPRAVLPFQLAEPAAHDAMNDWLGGLWFAPNGLQDYAHKGRKMDGIYVPYWTYDADTKSSYRGERGTVYYVTETVMRDGKAEQRRVQKIRWRPASGHVARWFDDILVLASKALPKKYTDALQPWDLSALEPYSPEFLAGFQAEGYTVELTEGYEEARAHMDRVIRRDVAFDIGGDRQRIHNVQTAVSDVSFKHILLPVWLAAYKYRGKSYRFVVNGQTGRVQGERPYSTWKIAFAVACAALAAAAFGYIIAQNQ